MIKSFLGLAASALLLAVSAAESPALERYDEPNGGPCMGGSMDGRWMRDLNLCKLAPLGMRRPDSGGSPVAKDGNLPSIDLEKACGVRANTNAEILGAKSLAAAGGFDRCMKSEQIARDALSAAWNDIPANYKAFCIAPGVYSPSYVEWISCLELRIDLKKAGRKQ